MKRILKQCRKSRANRDYEFKAINAWLIPVLLFYLLLLLLVHELFSIKTQRFLDLFFLIFI